MTVPNPELIPSARRAFAHKVLEPLALQETSILRRLVDDVYAAGSNDSKTATGKRQQRLKVKMRALHRAVHGTSCQQSASHHRLVVPSSQKT